MKKLLLLTLTVLAGMAYADPLAINQQTHATTTITQGYRTHTIAAGAGYSNRNSQFDRNSIASLNSVSEEMELVDHDDNPLTDPIPQATGNLIAEYAYDERSFNDATENIDSTYSSHYSGNYDSVEIRISNGQIGSVSGTSHETGQVDGLSNSNLVGTMGNMDDPEDGTGGTFYEEKGFGVFDPLDITDAESFAKGGPYYGKENLPNVVSANSGYVDDDGAFADTWGEPSNGSFGHYEVTDTTYSSLYLNPYTR